MSFNELRSLMNSTTLSTFDLKRVCLKGYEQNPEVYKDQWIPYMKAFPHHFEEPWPALTSNDKSTTRNLIPLATFHMAMSIQDLRNLPDLSNVTSLNLRWGLREETFVKDLRQFDTSLLKKLVFRGVSLLPRDVIYVMNPKRMPNLEHFSCTQTDIQGPLRFTHPTMKTLDLSYCPLRYQGLNLQGTSLESLYLGDTMTWGTETIENCCATLGSFPALRSLKKLYLMSNEISNVDLRVLVSQGHLKGLTHLDLHNNQVDERIFPVLKEWCPNLQEVDMSRTNLGSEPEDLPFTLR